MGGKLRSLVSFSVHCVTLNCGRAFESKRGEIPPSPYVTRVDALQDGAENCDGDNCPLFITHVFLCNRPYFTDTWGKVRSMLRDISHDARNVGEENKKILLQQFCLRSCAQICTALTDTWDDMESMLRAMILDARNFAEVRSRSYFRNIVWYIARNVAPCLRLYRSKRCFSCPFFVTYERLEKRPKTVFI